MPNLNLTDVSIVLDRSGSMEAIKSDTIGGYNHFISEQKKALGEVYVSLHQFNDEYETVYAGQPMQSVPPLDDKSFAPRGGTALLDAIGRTIVATGVRFERMNEAERPGNVLVVIITDGEENQSTEFTYSQVKKMVRHQEQKYSWTFVFLGANIDVEAVSANLGIPAGNAVGYTSNGEGTSRAFRKVSRATSNYRERKQRGEAVKDFSDLMDDKGAKPQKTSSNRPRTP